MAGRPYQICRGTSRGKSSRRYKRQTNRWLRRQWRDKGDSPPPNRSRYGYT